MGDGDDGRRQSGEDSESSIDDGSEPSGPPRDDNANPPQFTGDTDTDESIAEDSVDSDAESSDFPLGSRGDESPERRGPDRPLGGRRRFGTRDTGPKPRDGLRPALGWLASTDHGIVLFLREIIVSVLVVLMIGLLLFATSGVWPPLVAVESGSMEPHLYRGDLVFVMEEHRLAPEYAVGDTGIVPKEIGEDRDYTRFGGPGDVIVYRPFGVDDSTPVIHRAHFFVEKGENWYKKANPDYLQADSCEELRHCPAPYDGFITKGDNAVSNDYYDQARGISTPVKPQWVRGRAVVRVPWLGWVRLAASDMNLPGVSQAAESFGGPITTVAPA